MYIFLTLEFTLLYIMQCIEPIWYKSQNISINAEDFRIIGLPSDDYLPTLTERRNRADARELDTIRNDVKHPLHAKALEKVPLSGTERTGTVSYQGTVLFMMMFFELFLLIKISEFPSGTRTHNLLIAGETL